MSHKDMTVIRHNKGGMKTPTAVTELQAQIQQGELGGFTWMTRHLQLFDTFFVLMEKDDLDDFHDSSYGILLSFYSGNVTVVNRNKLIFDYCSLT